MKQFIITFGFNHKDTKGNLLRNCYTIIRALSEDYAREKMMKSKLHSQWSNIYKSKKDAGVKEYNLKFVKFKNL